MNIKIRDYKQDDLAALAELNTELGYPIDIEDMAKVMIQVESLTNTRTLVAELNDKVIGYLGMSVNYPWERSACFVRVQSLVVSEKYRQKGIGKSLMSAAESWAKELNAETIALNCGNRSEREPAHKFYQSLGFEIKTSGYRKKVI